MTIPPDAIETVLKNAPLEFLMAAAAGIPIESEVKIDAAGTAHVTLTTAVPVAVDWGRGVVCVRARDLEGQAMSVFSL